jgi:hypothetical protein
MQPRQILPATVAAASLSFAALVSAQKAMQTCSGGQCLPPSQLGCQHEECSMNIPRKLLVAAGLAAVVTAGVLATAAGAHTEHGRQAPVSIHDVATPVPSVRDGDPSIPDASMALRGQPDARAEQPATF